MNTKNTIEQIENEFLGAPPTDATRLVSTIYEIRKKPIDTLTVEDIRITIGQNRSLDVLMPLAMDYLRKDLFSEGDFYPGDLLLNVLRAKEFWDKHTQMKEELIEMYENGIHSIDDHLMYGDEIKEEIYDAYSALVR